MTDRQSSSHEEGQEEKRMGFEMKQRETEIKRMKTGR